MARRPLVRHPHAPRQTAIRLIAGVQPTSIRHPCLIVWVRPCAFHAPGVRRGMQAGAFMDAAPHPALWERIASATPGSGSATVSGRPAAGRSRIRSAPTGFARDTGPESTAQGRAALREGPPGDVAAQPHIALRGSVAPPHRHEAEQPHSRAAEQPRSRAAAHCRKPHPALWERIASATPGSGSATVSGRPAAGRSRIRSAPTRFPCDAGSGEPGAPGRKVAGQGCSVTFPAAAADSTAPCRA